MKYQTVAGLVVIWLVLATGLTAAGTSRSAPTPTPTPAHTFAYVLAAGNTVENIVMPTTQVVTPDGHIINESCFENAVIKSGTITVPASNITDPTTDEINERHNISRNAMIAVYKEFNVPANETVTLGCDFKIGTCTYTIVNLELFNDCANSSLPAFIPTATLTPIPTQKPTPTPKTPAFEALSATAALLAVFICRLRR